MPDPGSFVPSFSYTGYERSKPTDPKPGPQLDHDFASIATTTDSIVNSIKDIRRSDGQLNNGIVTLDTLAEDIRFVLKIDNEMSEPVFAVLEISDDIITLSNGLSDVKTLSNVVHYLPFAATVASEIDRVVLLADALPGIVNEIVGEAPPNTAWADYYAVHSPAIDLGDLLQMSAFANENQPVVRMSLSDGDSVIDLGTL